MSTHNAILLDIKNLENTRGAKVIIVATEWNSEIVEEQIEGARRVAKELEIEIVNVVFVPGAVEIPFAIKQITKYIHQNNKVVDAIIAFGAVIKGDTPHFEYVCNMVSDSVNALNLSSDIPVVFGVLTVNNTEQVWERLGGRHGHKGEEAMITAAKMITFKNNWK